MALDDAIRAADTVAELFVAGCQGDPVRSSHILVKVRVVSRYFDGVLCFVLLLACSLRSMCCEVVTYVFSHELLCI